MDARKCSSEPCIRLVEKNPRITLADPWMGGSGHDKKKLKFSNNNQKYNLQLNNSMKIFASILKY